MCFHAPSPPDRPDLERLGWGPFFEIQRQRLDRTDLLFARIVDEQRGACRAAGEFTGWVEVSGRFRHEAAGAADFPAVGDWVGVRARPDELVRGLTPRSDPGGRPPIRHDACERGIADVRLDRRSTIARRAAGRSVDQQVIAANVDTIFVVTTVARDLNPRRLERYLTMARETGAMPVVVLNKADLTDDAAAVVDAVRARLPLVDVIATSALGGAGVEALGPYLAPAQTVALLGSSGVGKSTLVNRLSGGEIQRVRGLDRDGKGRHTTTSRQLIELPGGALLIDTPGMRELQPWTDTSAVNGTFDDVMSLAVNCRFGDCAHDGEPGCAVAAAVAAGALDPDRLVSYHRLVRELAFEERKHDKAAAAGQKRRLKQMMKAAKALYRDRERS